MTRDYRPTIFLPRTDFPMKGNLLQKEPELLDFWNRIQLSKKQRLRRRGCEKFILHDGPPYANGHIHMGHALNKILKDIVNRSQFMAGKDVVFVPGWDCHGLPIEWKVEEEYREKGLKKQDVSSPLFRRACREFATFWLEIQSREFQRLGLIGDFENPYTTMDFEAEAEIVRQLLILLMKGYVYRGERPVLWSVVEETALAEAEVEYHDVASTSIYVRFPLQQGGSSLPVSSPALGGESASVVIWTTTPWTLPGNRAVAYGEALTYVVGRVLQVDEESRARVGEILIVAKERQEDFCRDVGITAFEVICLEKGRAFREMVCDHPLKKGGYSFPVPLLPAAHVAADTGTGFVHTAPAHGVEDFALAQLFGLSIPQTVGADGRFDEHVPLFAGQHIYHVNRSISKALEGEGALLQEKRIFHSYPHSWRSKTPLIYRTTPQWFVAMEGEQKLREKALQAIKNVSWFPASAQTRITSMIESRPDWCISRQRAWGVPLTLFVHKKTGKPLRDDAVNQRILDAIQREGAEAWFSSSPAAFLAPQYSPDDFEQITDILDVWFDSGVTYSFVLKNRLELEFPASLYLEGSDQHRGWFQSSLLTACALEGMAPYRAVLTHGFTVDEAGRKMSKSVGNVVSTQQIIEKKGADILRLWVAWTDSKADMRIGPDILKHLEDIYRRFRNTLRYLLGAIGDFSKEEAPQFEAFPELEKWVCHRLRELDLKIKPLFKSYNFQEVIREIHHFCSVDLSAFYFDVRKDALYCDGKDLLLRRAARTVMKSIFSCLTRWLAPILCFTTEEAWQSLYGKDASIHLEDFYLEDFRPEDSHLEDFLRPNERWFQPQLVEKYQVLRDLRRVVTGALEGARASRVIGSSLQAHPNVYLSSSYRPFLEGVAFEELVLTSGITLFWDKKVPEGTANYTLPEVENVTVVMALSQGEKCSRCWKVLLEVGQNAAYTDLCRRCAQVVHEMDLKCGVS